MRIDKSTYEKYFVVAKNRESSGSIRAAHLNLNALAVLAAITAVAVGILIGMFLAIRKLRSTSNDLSERLFHQRSQLREADQVLANRQAANREILQNCLDAEERHRQILQDCESVDRRYQSTQSLLVRSQNTLVSLDNEIHAKRLTLTATDSEIQASSANLGAVYTYIAQGVDEVGILGERFKELYRNWELQDNLVFEFMSVDLLKKLCEVDRETLIEAIVRQGLFEICCISLEPICNSSQCVYLDTNPRVAYNCVDLQRHFRINGLVCPTTRKRPKAGYFPFRYPVFSLLGQATLTQDERKDVVKTFLEYRLQKIKDIVRETCITFDVNCSVSSALVARPAITITSTSG